MTGKRLLVVFAIIGFIFANDSIPLNKNEQGNIKLSQKPNTPFSTEKLKSDFGNNSNINLWGYFGKMIIVFILLVGLLFVISRFTNNNSFIKKNQNNHFKILYEQYLSSKQKIILVKVFDNYLLLGISDQSINLLTKFNKNEINEDTLNLLNSKSIFTSFLGQYFTK
jgi:flagellar biosynthetic protein FliO